jgi:hypothetical protein
MNQISITLQYPLNRNLSVNELFGAAIEAADQMGLTVLSAKRGPKMCIELDCYTSFNVEVCDYDDACHCLFMNMAQAGLDLDFTVNESRSRFDQVTAADA